jgi:hypothetical protein
MSTESVTRMSMLLIEARPTPLNVSWHGMDIPRHGIALQLLSNSLLHLDTL